MVPLAASAVFSSAMFSRPHNQQQCFIHHHLDTSLCQVVYKPESKMLALFELHDIRLPRGEQRRSFLEQKDLLHGNLQMPEASG